MKWPNVKLIYLRELRDQLRDRRTLFTVVVMPMLLYPLMGMAMLQVAQFMREHPTHVWLVGQDHLPDTPALLTEGQFNPQYAVGSDQTLLEVFTSQQGDDSFYRLVEDFRERAQSHQAGELVDKLIQQEMRRRQADVAVFIPRPVEIPQPGDFEEASGEASIDVAPVYVFQNTAVDRSRIGGGRVERVLQQWRKDLVAETMKRHELAPELLQGVKITSADVADQVGKQAAVWSKIFPFIVMIWSLTGAFYPAIDLCAGEKERGTFETLLSSPAARSEIAIGKLLTVMSFSMTTSVLNLLSMGLTGLFVASRLGGGFNMGPPPVSSIGWLLLALVPISALFSAVALAAAAFARSSKEGQYYLVPLMMICMPLMMIPMLPAAKLDLGSSLIPVSGLMLLLRGLIEGQYRECLQFASPVVAVTLVCCWLAIRWVVAQFNSESVLFRPSERFGVGAWVRHLMRQRHQMPSLGSAILCGLVILMAKFFVGMVVQVPVDFQSFARQTVIILVATIGVPAILMALFLTTNPWKSLRLRGCSIPMAAAAVLAAVLLHPLMTWFTSLVMVIYPPADDLFQMQSVVSAILDTAPGWWAILAVFALAPAIIEEVAFRGFILSGAQSLRSKWQAVVLTALLFGAAHGVLQQSVITFGVGLVLGLLAVTTRSLWPCILFHLTHNSLTVLLSMADPAVVESSLGLSWVLTAEQSQSYQYAVLPGILMSIGGLLLLAWFVRLDVQESSPESASHVWFSRWFRRWRQPSG